MDPQLTGNNIFYFYESLKFSGVYFSNFAPCLLNEETSHCGHIYDITSSRRKGCHTYYFYLKTAGAETEFWTFFIHMSYDKSLLIISLLVEN